MPDSPVLFSGGRVIQLEIPLFDSLQDAIASPQDAQLLDLLREFDAAIANLDDRHVLEVASEAILRLAMIVEAKYVGVIEGVQAEVQASQSRDPIVPIDFFDRYVRQSMLVNLDQYIEPIPLLPLPVQLEGDWAIASALDLGCVSEPEMMQAIQEAMIDDAAVLLEGLPDRNAASQPMDLDAVKHLAHGEELDHWSAELVEAIEKLQTRKRKSISLLDLVCTLESSRTRSKRKDCLIDLWLAFLLGKHSYHLCRIAHDFYSMVGIKVV
ncbi:hypothetical protein NC981_23345 [Leptolyngbya sp. DQ-M1]|uniref:hypothetical protein n=1 Tax=Leptolyngbya sp. DQ-M1 TaxID=2933920 RepID=UPI00329A6500